MLPRMRTIVLGVVLLGACGGDGGGTAIDAAAVDSPPADSPTGVDAQTAFALTSPTITEGQPIPAVHACTGADTSPQFVWAGAPAGSMSYALVLTDLSFNNFVHSVIYDIPGTASGLPADVDKVYAPSDVAGAHQTLAFDGTTRGYRGPCPNAMHTYEFALYALSTPTLPGATMSTARGAAVTMIMANAIASTKLTATFAP